MKTTREQIITHLSATPVSNGELAALLGITKQAVHKHLVGLRAAGLAKQVGRGQVELLGVSRGDTIEIAVTDDGVGAFRKVQDYFGLRDELEAIAHLAKGQQTTWAARHTGQGLFFSSRAVDVFEVEAGNRVWQVDNLRNDTTVLPGVRRSGTRVVLRTRRERTLTLKEVFDRHSIEEYAFDKGAVRVALSNHGTEFVSRSEAKRLGVGLELYGEVELDFTGVRAVGQGFVDELFRVWVQDNPGTAFSYINANEEVTFMIERGLPRRSGSLRSGSSGATAG